MMLLANGAVLKVIMAIGLAAPALATPAEPPVIRSNPFAQPAGFERGVRTTPAGWALRATLVDGDHALANINGQVLAVGDRLGKATVQRIEIGQVELNVDGRTITLKLHDTDAQANNETKNND